MTTKIGTIYDAIVDVIEANLTDYKRIANPYAMNENTFHQLSKGFGLAIGGGNDTERYLGCLVTWRRTFTVLLTEQMIATQNDHSTRETVEKSILDAHDILRKAFYNNSTLSGNAIKTTITDDAGVGFIATERAKFLVMEMVLEVEYQESPT
jgi:hypothetical protein